METHYRAELHHDQISAQQTRSAEIAAGRVVSRNDAGTAARRIARLEAKQRRTTPMRDGAGHYIAHIGSGYDVHAAATTKQVWAQTLERLGQ